MNNLRRLLFIIPFLATLAASAVDYPEMYVKGSFNSWQPEESYRMTRNGKDYTITLDYLDGSFKLSGETWTYNLGGEIKDITIGSSCTVRGVQDGHNFIASNLRNVTISVTLSIADDESGLNPSDITIVCEPSSLPAGVSGTLPVLYINAFKTDSEGNILVDAGGNPLLDNEVIDYNLSHKNYFVGEYWLDVNGCQWMIDEGAESIGSADEPLPLKIKARGNWTRKGFSKKPFKIKLDKKQDLLGVTPEKSKNYALMAHADDSYGFMRNFTTFRIGRRIGLESTPRQQPVELVINGDYRGLYFLTESVEVGAGRVDITKLEDLDANPENVSGGYIVELDNYDEDNQIRMEEQTCVSGYRLDALRVTWDTPEDYSDLQKRFITDQFTAINNLVGRNDDALWSYLDLDDAVRYYIAREMVSDVEAYHGSTYLYRDRGEGMKWHFSPIWDCGNAFNGSTSAFFYDNSPFGNTWIPSMRANARFNDCLSKTWKWFMSTRYDGLIAEIDDYVSHISKAVRADYARWRNEPTPEGGNAVCDNTDMTARRNSVVGHLENKIAWLATKFGNYSGTHAEPSRDATPAAPLPDYAQSELPSIHVEDTEASGATFYNLQGIPVATPAPGQFVISVIDGRAVKFIAR